MWEHGFSLLEQVLELLDVVDLQLRQLGGEAGVVHRDQRRVGVLRAAVADEEDGALVDLGKGNSVFPRDRRPVLVVRLLLTDL